MRKIKINGGKPLFGEVVLSGAKNAVLPIISATILTKNKVVLENVPDISDVENSCEIIRKMGGSAVFENNVLILNCENINEYRIPQEEALKMRSSVLFCGGMLARFKKVFIGGSGGCKLGKRPIDLHLKALKKMGAKVLEDKNGIYLKTEKLKGAEIEFEYASVGATENIIIAATFAKGKTLIKNAAKEPEICDLANFLNMLGADIKGAGEDMIAINGVEELKGGRYKIMPDRIEAGTYLCAVAATGGNVVLKNVISSHLKPLIDELVKCGCVINYGCDVLKISSEGKLKGGIKVKTAPFPMFPTDLQAPLTAMLAISKGTSVIKENIFSSRNGHIKQLNKMGANIEVLADNKFMVKGCEKLKGAIVKATDLRAGAALIIAGLCAKGETIIENADYIYRGYEKIVEKFNKLGADICECDSGFSA